MVLASSDRIPRAPSYSSSYQVHNFSHTGLSPSLVCFSNTILLNYGFVTCNIGLGWSPFNRLYLGNRYCFLFLWVLRCFSSPGSPHYTMDSCNDNAHLCTLRSRIRTSVDLCSLTAPHSFSQLATSFVGAWYLGIHRMLFVA